MYTLEVHVLHNCTVFTLNTLYMYFTTVQCPHTTHYTCSSQLYSVHTQHIIHVLHNCTVFTLNTLYMYFTTVQCPHTTHYTCSSQLYSVHTQHIIHVLHNCTVSTHDTLYMYTYKYTLLKFCFNFSLLVPSCGDADRHGHLCWRSQEQGRASLWSRGRAVWLVIHRGPHGTDHVRVWPGSGHYAPRSTYPERWPKRRHLAPSHKSLLPSVLE